jgi:hypothetical protein
MKKHLFFPSLLVLLLIFACSEEEDVIVLSDTDYFPLTIDNTWNYNNSMAQNGTTLNGNEQLMVDSKTQQDEFEFSRNTNAVAGVFTQVLTSGKVNKQEENERINYNGELTLALGDGLSEVVFPLENVTLYDAGLSNGDVMSISSGTFEESINGFTVDFNFEVRSIHHGFSVNETVNGTLYDDVFISKTLVRLSASTFIVINDFTLLQEQEIIVIKNYYAKDVGLILSEVEAEIIFEDIPEQLNVEIPDVNFTSNQTLQNYTLL